MKIQNLSDFTSQRIWPKYLEPHDKNYALSVGTFSNVNKEEMHIIPLIIELPELPEMEHGNEKLPFTFEEELTEDNKYITNLIGLL